MLRDKQGGHQYSIKTAQRQAFMQVFMLHAVEGKVDKQALRALFQRIGYFISEQHFEDICTRAFEFKDTVSFQQFMDLFKVRESPHSLTDIKNAFRLLAGQQDEFLPLQTLYQIFRKAGVEKDRVQDLLVVLSQFVDRKRGVFNYRQFLGQLS